MLQRIIWKIHLVFWLLALVVGSASTSLAATPSITGFTPTKGAAGDNVIITGANFVFPNLSSNKVKFNGTRAAVTMAPSGDHLVVTVPEKAIPGPITIDNSHGSVTSPNAFEVISTKDQIASSGTAPGPGDRKILDTYMSGFRMADVADSPEYYASPGSKLWVDSHVDNKGNVIVHFAENWTNPKVGSEVVNPDYSKQCTGGLVKPGVKYSIKAIELQDTAALSRGADYGLLVVPYKFHISDHSLSGAATVGGYAGMQIASPGVAISLVGAAGVGVVPVTTVQNGTSTTNNAASFTVAGGTIISLTKAGLFQIGILCGLDWAGKGSQYKHEGKPWIALSFGTNLTK